MIEDLSTIEEQLRAMLIKHIPPLRAAKDSDTGFEVCGTKEVMQGRQKVAGHYFASVVPKPKDIRLYFFPIYTHTDAFQTSDELRKMLKGKSCFHLKKISPEVIQEIDHMIDRGIDLYKEDELI